MIILLDECVTKRLKPYLPEYKVYTVTEMRWNGIKNGDLMVLCVDNNIDLLLTINKNLMFQQNIDELNLTIAVLNCFTSKIDELKLFIPSLKGQIGTMKKHKAYLIDK